MLMQNLRNKDSKTWTAEATKLEQQRQKYRFIGKNITVQKQQQAKDELIEPLMETQAMILESISKQHQTEKSNETSKMFLSVSHTLQATKKQTIPVYPTRRNNQSKWIWDTG